MNIIKYISYACILTVSCNAFSMDLHKSKSTIEDAQLTILGLQHLSEQHQATYFDLLGKKDTNNPDFIDLRNIAQHKMHPRTKKMVTPIESMSYYPKTNTTLTSVHPTTRILNFTLHLNQEDHQQFKNYLNQQTINNSPEYQKLLTGKSDNQEIQKLLNHALIRRNPHTNKIVTPLSNTKSMCPQVSLDKLTILKEEHTASLNRKKQPLPLKIKIKSDRVITRSPKISPEKRSRLLFSI